MTKISQKTLKKIIGFALFAKYFIFCLIKQGKKGICYCSRCLNEDMIYKIKVWFVKKLGGNQSDLVEPFEWNLNNLQKNLGQFELEHENIVKLVQKFKFDSSITINFGEITKTNGIISIQKKKFKEIDFILERPPKKAIKYK